MSDSAQMLEAPNPETEAVESKERDTKGVSYIMNLVAVYAIFFVSMIIIAWFGIFSEV
jgi:hypothetical protein